MAWFNHLDPFILNFVSAKNAKKKTQGAREPGLPGPQAEPWFIVFIIMFSIEKALKGQKWRCIPPQK
jgi:hypothetical protein